MDLHCSFYDLYSQYLFDNFECYNACVLDQNTNKHFCALCHFAEAEDNLKILDVGCGSGQFLNFVFNNFDNIKAKGIDLSQRQIAIAQKNSAGPTYQRSDFNSFSEGNYDRIFFNETIGYAGDNQYNLLKKYQTMLNPNGILVISTFCKHKNLNYFNFEKLQAIYKQCGYAEGFSLRVKITIADWLEYKRLDFNFVKNNFKFKIYEKKIEVQKKWLTKQPARRYIRHADIDLLDSYAVFKIYGPKEENQKTNSRCGAQAPSCSKVPEEEILGQRDDDLEKTDAEI